MKVQEIDVDHNIWGKSVPYLKVNTTRKKPIPVAVNLVHVPGDLVKLHKYIYLTADISFVKGISFFLALSMNICFTDFNHLVNRKVETIFNSFIDICRYYMKCGFYIKLFVKMDNVPY